MPIRRTFTIILLLALLGLGQRPSLASRTQSSESPIYYPGQLLVASPDISDRRFKKSVIFLVKHDAKGSYGIIVNKVIGEQTVAKLMQDFGLDPKGATGTMNLHYGGPVNPKSVFILHTSDYKGSKTRAVHGTISFTIDVGILRAVAKGNSPRHMLLAIGYAGWGPKQLGDEVARGDWSLATATEELVFDGGRSDIWQRIVEASQVPL